MDEQAFRRYLKRGGRSSRAVDRIIRMVRECGEYLRTERRVEGLDAAAPADLEAFVAWLESLPKASANTHLWAIRYYYQFSGNSNLGRAAKQLRSGRIQRQPFSLGDFRGVEPAVVDKLAAQGINNVSQMLEAGRTPEGRSELSESSGVPLAAILELVKLSDLARIPGVKGIRARLYLDAGVDTLDKLASWDPESLRIMLLEFVERSGFEGIAPLPAEARSTVATAKQLPRIVQY